MSLVPLIAGAIIGIVATPLTSWVSWRTGKGQRDESDWRASVRARDTEAREAIRQALRDTERVRAALEGLHPGQKDNYTYRIPSDLVSDAIVSCRLVLDAELRELAVGGLSTARAVTYSSVMWCGSLPSQEQEKLLSAVASILAARLRDDSIAADDVKAIQEASEGLEEEYQTDVEAWERAESRRGGE